MRFAFKTSPQNTTWGDMPAVWKEADGIELFQLGWTFDHFYPIFSDSTGPCLEGWVTLTALVQATRRLGSGRWSPAFTIVIPRSWPLAATLDIVSACGWKWASAPGGMRNSPAPTASSLAARPMQPPVRGSVPGHRQPADAAHHPFRGPVLPVHWRALRA